MPPHETTQELPTEYPSNEDLIERLYEETLVPPHRRCDGDTIYGLLGLLVLLTMLLISTGVIPLYEWSG